MIFTSYAQLIIFVEGDDDEDFFHEVIEPRLTRFGFDVNYVQYSKRKKELRGNYIKAIDSMPFADYIYIADFDEKGKDSRNQAWLRTKKCFSRRKTELRKNLRQLDPERVHLVVNCIEGWYLAGLSSAKAKRLKVKLKGSTDSLCKPQFEGLVPQGMTPSTFKEEILEDYRFKEAQDRSKSFKRFTKRCLSDGAPLKKAQKRCKS